jgi:putative PIN family toxin of toxin-antitoxin system
VRAVVDTNVWVSALIAPLGPARQIVQAVVDRRIDAICSWELAAEVADVLRRPRLARRYAITEQDVRDVLAVLAPLLPTVEVDIEMRDEDDLPVLRAALAGRAQAIITGDRDFHDDAALRAWLAQRGIELLTPAQALEYLR